MMMTTTARFRRLAATVVATALMAAAGAVPLLASDALSLRSNITVTSDIVRVGDLFANAGGAADIPLFRSPSPGRSGLLTARRVAYAVRNHGLDWNNPLRIARIAVRRDGRTIPLAEIETAIKARIGSLDGTVRATQLDLAFDDTPGPLVVPSDVEQDLAVLHADFDARTGRFVAVLTTSSESAGTVEHRYTGRATVVVSAPVLVRPVARGNRIGRDDVTMTTVPRASVPAAVLLEPSDVVGMVATRSLGIGKLIRVRDIEQPRVVRKSDLVTVVYVVPGLQLTAKAQALESGGRGDLVTIMNPRSKRTFEAVVTGPGVVSAVLAGPGQLAALARQPD